MSNCICESPNIRLDNIHYKKLNIDLTLLDDSEGYGAIIMENNSTIAVFDINYCPKCGRNLQGV